MTRTFCCDMDNDCCLARVDDAKLAPRHLLRMVEGWAFSVFEFDMEGWHPVSNQRSTTSFFFFCLVRKRSYWLFKLHRFVLCTSIATLLRDKTDFHPYVSCAEDHCPLRCTCRRNVVEVSAANPAPTWADSWTQLTDCVWGGKQWELEDTQRVQRCIVQ